jgi:hypothetical protein
MTSAEIVCEILWFCLRKCPVPFGGSIIDSLKIRLFSKGVCLCLIVFVVIVHGKKEDTDGGRVSLVDVCLVC